MDWIQFLTIVFANLGMFLWSRSEAREDSRNSQNLIIAIKEEIKDFHGRLCSLEEKTRK